MAQRHLDRLSAVDAGFLHLEDSSNTHTHIGGLAVLEGPPPSGEEFRSHIASRLPLVPRYRQRLVHPPFRTGRPLWADDAEFDIVYHVRHTALPSPGGHAQLMTLVGRIFSQRLDRTKPLWELWLVEGLEGDRFALLNKTHHALVDGVGGVDLLTALVDLSRETPAPEPARWTPFAAPTSAGLLLRGIRGATRSAVGLAGAAVRLAQEPQRATGYAVETAQGLGEVVKTVADPAPPSPLNRPPGPHRRYATLTFPLGDLKTIKNELGGTVNDVALTVVAGGLGKYFARHGREAAATTLRTCVPVSVRDEGERGEAGNRITIMVAPLPVGVTDPAERLRRVREAMDGLKQSKQAVGATTLTSMQDFMPPTVLAQASRVQFSPRIYNLMVTNVPGPQFPVYVLGRQAQRIFPLAFLAAGHLLTVGIISYDGEMNVGLIADSDGLPDLDALASDFTDSMRELKARAGSPGAGKNQSRGVRPATSPTVTSRDEAGGV